jgi:hypothetical protein
MRRLQGAYGVGYLLTYTASKEWIGEKFLEVSPHRIGGDAGPRAIGCPNCELPMLRMFLLAGKDPFLARSIGLAEGADFDVQFCWRCEASQDWLQYRLRANAPPELAHARIGGVIPDFPYPDYPAFFPEGGVLPVPLPESAVNDEGELRSWADDEGHEGPGSVMSNFGLVREERHQFLGKMFVRDETQIGVCAGCGATMSLVMTVADHNLHPMGMANYMGVMLAVYWCARCQMIAIRQQCD